MRFLHNNSGFKQPRTGTWSQPPVQSVKSQVRKPVGAQTRKRMKNAGNTGTGNGKNVKNIPLVSTVQNIIQKLFLPQKEIKEQIVSQNFHKIFQEIRIYALKKS